MATSVTLHPADPALYEKLARGEAPSGLRLPEGGIDTPEVLSLLRDVAQRLGPDGGAWLVEADGMVAGLCGFKAPPRDGIAEIGYGTVPALRGRGIATAAVRAMVGEARRGGLTALTAATGTGNPASARVLEKAAFDRTGRQDDLTDRPRDLWRCEVAPWTEARLMAFLTQHDVPATLHRHPPLRTVEESRALRGEMPGAHCKNMFLKSKKGELVLVTCGEGRQIRIRDLEKAIGVRKLSFAPAERLMEHLGVTPGAVTPLAVLNDADRAVRVILDAQMMRADVLNCHPLHNEATVAMSSSDLLRIFALTGHFPETVDFDALEAAALAA